jgi:hypothetical protein
LRGLGFTFLCLIRGVMFGRFLRVMGRMNVVTLRYMRMMSGLFVVAALVVLRSLLVMFRRVLMMLRRLAVVLRSYMISHVIVPSSLVGFRSSAHI